eukprot:1065575-Lingulodinium_polyedra.AAC.1
MAQTVVKSAFMQRSDAVQSSHCQAMFWQWVQTHHLCSGGRSNARNWLERGPAIIHLGLAVCCRPIPVC